MSENYTKWVACWGTATSITERKEAVYAKNLTLQYPLRICFSGSALRLHLSNLTGTESVEITKTRIIKDGEAVPVRFGGSEKAQIQAGAEIESDDTALFLRAGEEITVSLYLSSCTQMNAGTLLSGPLSKGVYAYGDFAETPSASIPAASKRNTSWFYFLNTVDILTEEKNHALICYGDSITAQSWPDYLALRCAENGFGDVSIIRRAVCGTRILREYDCLTYAAYGLKGEKRFSREIRAAGASAVIIQHGINDIIHPVGVETNIFRPWSDLPSVDELINGVKTLYLKAARERGLSVWSGTLLPIHGWRTYAPFREELREGFNEWLRSSPLFDGCIDFDKAVRNENERTKFKDGFDSGDHLHPSEEAYKAMANCVPEILF